MKIAVNARLLNERKGGPYRYLVNILNELAAIDTENIYYLISNESVDENFQFLRNSNFKQIIFPVKNRIIFDYFFLPVLTYFKNFDFCIFPKTTFAIHAKCEKIPIFHDIIYFEKFPFREFNFFDNLHHKLMIPINTKFSNMNIAVSEFTAKRMVELLGIRREKITVIYEAVESTFKKIEDKTLLNEVKERLNINTPFCFFAGSLSPRKNILNILKAFEMVKDNIPHSIYFTAGESWNDNSIFDYIKKKKLESRVVKLGYLSEEDLVAVYNLADCYLYPSLYEGFGLPILEAQACGCPVITSNVSSCPEIAGDSAFLVNPYNVEEIADAIVNISTDKNLKKELIEKGFKNLKRFSWKEAAKKHLQLLEMIFRNKNK